MFAASTRAYDGDERLWLFLEPALDRITYSPTLKPIYSSVTVFVFLKIYGQVDSVLLESNV